MTIPGTDQRSLGRRARDEQIAAEVQLPPLELPRDTPPSSVEAHLARRHRPLAVAGVVENGLVRPLDPRGEAAGTLAGHHCSVGGDVTAGAARMPAPNQSLQPTGAASRRFETPQHSGGPGC